MGVVKVSPNRMLRSRSRLQLELELQFVVLEDLLVYSFSRCFA